MNRGYIGGGQYGWNGRYKSLQTLSIGLIREKEARMLGKLGS